MARKGVGREGNISWSSFTFGMRCLVLTECAATRREGRCLAWLMARLLLLQFTSGTLTPGENVERGGETGEHKDGAVQVAKGRLIML
eukprot:3015024-Rhodomonas_salina.1